MALARPLAHPPPAESEAPPAHHVLSFQREQIRTSCGLHLCPSKSFPGPEWRGCSLLHEPLACYALGSTPETSTPVQAGKTRALGVGVCNVAFLSSSPGTDLKLPTPLGPVYPPFLSSPSSKAVGRSWQLSPPAAKNFQIHDVSLPGAPLLPRPCRLRGETVPHTGAS